MGTHFRGPVFSELGYIVGRNPPARGTHFRGPVDSENGFNTGSGLLQRGTHFRGPVFSELGFGGEVEIQSLRSLASDVAAAQHIIPDVAGGLGTRLLVIISWDRQAGVVIQDGANYGATPLIQVDLSQGNATGLRVMELASPTGIEDLTLNFSAATNAAAFILVLAEEGGLGPTAEEIGTDVSSSVNVTIDAGGVGYSALALTIGQDATADDGQAEVPVLLFDGGARSLELSMKGGDVLTPFGWSWPAASGFIHITTPVNPAG